MNLFKRPDREYMLIGLISAAFVIDFTVPGTAWLLAFVAFLGVIPTLISAARAVIKIKISIDVFNTFAILISYATGEWRSAGFIALMLTFARLLEWFTETRTQDAMTELLKLKPLEAIREQNGQIEEIPVGAVRLDDILLVKPASRVPVDGVVVFGTSYVNEASVTGESALVEKIVGDPVISSTLVESGLLKIRATRVGMDSTIERMAALMREASLNKSRSERLADRFATIFLPLVGLLGLGTYLLTKNLGMTAALFLVACADDMSVAIPLSMTASLGYAAKRGVIIKGGEWLDVLARIKTVILDKTGTLTYGTLAIEKAELTAGVDETAFWQSVAVAEKFSEHPVGKAMYREAIKHVKDAPDPDAFRVEKGKGVWARHGKDEIAIGNEKLAEEIGSAIPTSFKESASSFYVFLNGTCVGNIFVADLPRPEAKASLRKLQASGARKVLMLTGDNEQTAAKIAKALGITDFKASMSPEDKLRFLEEELRNDGTVAMVGDGINDAPALARSDVGIAMGGGGTAVAAEAANVVILTDNLSRLPEMIELGQRTRSVIYGDMAIWFVSNLIGFALVFTGIAGPALAAFYNFATDFLPLMNSSRLFRGRKETK